MTVSTSITSITIGVLALQGAFSEHLQLLRQASSTLNLDSQISFVFTEVRTAEELEQCDALILPGGESTSISLIADRSGLLEPLREFVKVLRRPTWGTCAGMILLAEEANRTKKGGQELIGGLDVRVARNHFGRQIDSFETPIHLAFLGADSAVFPACFIRAPIVEAVIPHVTPTGLPTSTSDDTISVAAPSKMPLDSVAAAFVSPDVEILARIPNKGITSKGEPNANSEDSTIVAVRQGNCFGTSFHPELSTDTRVHVWWLCQVVKAVEKKHSLTAERV